MEIFYIRNAIRYAGWNKMVTGFDIIGVDKNLQEHWIRRTGAYIIDLAIIAIAIWVAFWLLRVKGWIEYGLVSGIVFLLYCVIFEATANKTIGKAILGLEVTAKSGYMDFSKALLRNISKFFWYIFPFLDWVIGMATEGDPRQRFLDRFAGTTVVQEYEATRQVYSQRTAPNNIPKELPTEKCVYCNAPLIEIEAGRFQCSNCGIIQ